MSPEEHAEAEYPRESCGLMIGNRYKPCRNIADDPDHSFRLAPGDWEPEATTIVHSHPLGGRYLSISDRVGQHQSKSDWWLVVREIDYPNHKKSCGSWAIYKYPWRPLLLGRQFDYGRADCCTLFADAYRLAGIALIDRPRTTINQDRINDVINKQLMLNGLDLVDNDDLKPGDIIITSHGGYPSHAALYLTDNRILHHPKDQLSRVDQWDGFWRRHHAKTWRHRQWQPSCYTAISNDLAASIN